MNKKLSRVQPMPYKYVKTWFEKNFPYYSDQPAFDEDGFVVDNASFASAAAMVREVETAMQDKQTNLIPAEVKVA